LKGHWNKIGHSYLIFGIIFAVLATLNIVLPNKDPTNDLYSLIVGVAYFGVSASWFTLYLRWRGLIFKKRK
jgi:hypothetical protein